MVNSSIEINGYEIFYISKKRYKGERYIKIFYIIDSNGDFLTDNEMIVELELELVLKEINSF